jgi:hypothetical protein
MSRFLASLIIGSIIVVCGLFKEKILRRKFDQYKWYYMMTSPGPAGVSIVAWLSFLIDMAIFFVLLYFFLTGVLYRVGHYQ